jgi:hypothetical protein
VNEELCFLVDTSEADGDTISRAVVSERAKARPFHHVPTVTTAAKAAQAGGTNTTQPDIYESVGKQSTSHLQQTSHSAMNTHIS